MLNKLSATFVKHARSTGLHGDGGGLYLRIATAGSKGWIFRYRDRQTGKLRDMGLGPTRDISLAEARELAARQRKLLHLHKDPITERQRERAEARAVAGRLVTFDQAAQGCFESRASEFRNAKHKSDWINSLARYASPVLGNLPVADIETAHVVKALAPIWQDKTETATRTRQRIEAVLSWATVSGYRQGDNPARWKDNLEHVLPRPSKIRRVRHHRALPWQEMASFMAALRQRAGTAARALEFAILTAARSGEVRLATWDEIDLATHAWRIPGERMKAGLPHVVPLSTAALEVLEALPRREDSPYVFAAPRGGPLSDMALSAVCRRMAVDAVPHGFRSSFKDWARRMGTHADEVSELALAHVNSDATRSAYARDNLLAQRTQMMAAWADFCDAPVEGGKVVALRAARVER